MRLDRPCFYKRSTSDVVSQTWLWELVSRSFRGGMPFWRRAVGTAELLGRQGCWDGGLVRRGLLRQWIGSETERFGEAELWGRDFWGGREGRCGAECFFPADCLRREDCLWGQRRSSSHAPSFSQERPRRCSVRVSKRFEGRSCDSPFVSRRGCLDWERRRGAIVRDCASRAFALRRMEASTVAWRASFTVAGATYPVEGAATSTTSVPLFRLVEAESVLVN